jgi:hypothetical protein
MEKQGQRQLLSDFTNKLSTGDTKGALSMAGDIGDPNLALKLVSSMKEEDALKTLQGMNNSNGTTASAGLTPSVYANNSQLGTFGASANRVLGFEGADGKVTTDNNGAPVKFGINGAAHPGLDIANLSKGQAMQIYKKEYWDALGLDEVAKQNPALAHAAFDTAINAGVGKAKELMQASGGDANKLLDLRQQFNQQLIQSDPNGKYGPNVQKAWDDRLNNLRSDIGGGQQQPGQAGGDAKSQIANIDRMLQIPNLSDSVKEQLKLRQAGLTRQVEWGYKDQTLPGATIDAQVQARMEKGKQLGLSGSDLQTYALSGNLPKPGEQMTPGQKKVSEGFADDYNKIYKPGLSSGNKTIAMLGQMEELMKDPSFYSGTGGEAVTKAKKFFSSMGITTPDGASANEVFDAYNKQLTLAAMNGTLGPGVSNADVSFITSQNPSLANTPEGNAELIKRAKALAQRQVDIGKQANEYIKKHGELDAGFEEQISKYADEHPLFEQKQQQSPKFASQGVETDLADLQRAITARPDLKDKLEQRFKEIHPNYNR